MMTLPYEEKYAVNNTREFLRSILAMKGRVRLTELRKQAGRLLKHYPMEYRVEKLWGQDDS